MTPREAELIERFYYQARIAGCPQDQALRYRQAGVYLQPKQLQFAAAARLCDLPGGPTEIGFGGAMGGGKSFCMLAQLGVDDCQRQPGLKCLLLRKSGQSNLENLNDLRIQCFHKTPHTFTGKGIIEFPNGSRIISGHFQHEKDIDHYLGLEYDVIGVEETTTLVAKKYRHISSRNRTSKPNWRPRIYSNGNPGGVGHQFYKSKFIVPYRMKDERETRFIPSLPTDNVHLNPDYVPNLKRILVGWERKAWLEGDWDIAAGQFFTNFRHDIHVFPNAEQVEFDDRRAVEWRGSFDYGFTHPTAVYLGAKDGNGNWYILEEHWKQKALPETHSGLIKAKIELHKKYQSVGGEIQERALKVDDLAQFTAGTDAFSTESDGKCVVDDYKKLGINLRPAVTDRVNGWAEIQRLLGDQEAGIRPKLFIHRRCKKLIECLPSLQHDPDHPEDVLKADIDDEGNGGDDPCFVAGTMIQCIEGQKPIEEIAIGDFVLTRKGFCTVTEAGLTGIKRPVLSVKLSNGSVLTGTGNHPVWVESDGWKRIDSLSYLDRIQECELMKSCSTESSSGDIQKLDSYHTGNISHQRPTIEGTESVRFIRKFGRALMELFRKDSTFITRTKIRLITRSIIWNVLSDTITSLCTLRKFRLKNRGEDLSLQERLPLCGMVRQKESNGTGNTVERLGKQGSRFKRSAIRAEQLSMISQGVTDQGFAQTLVRRGGVSEAGLITKNENALIAESDSRLINTPKKNVAGVYVLNVEEAGKADVYNLTVEGVPEYFANGVLVHNCDSLRYMLAKKVHTLQTRNLGGT